MKPGSSLDRSVVLMRLIACLISVTPALLGAQGPPAAERAAASITPDDFMRRVALIADDSMMGRANGSPGLERTTQYVEAEFRRYGLRPGGDSGTYRQRFRLVRWTVDPDRSAIELVGSRAGRLSRLTAQLGKEARYVDGPIPAGPIRGQVLLLAGDTTPGLDVKDRVILLVLDYSRAVPPTLSQQIYRLAAAGPKAVLLLSNRDSGTFSDRLRTAGTPRLTTESPKDTAAMAPVLELHERTLAPLMENVGISPDRLRRVTRGQRRLVESLTAEIRLARRVMSLMDAANVVGILEGGDPVLRHQYVAYSAHVDHIGITAGLPDSINNGADDNASGVAGLLELAEAFSRPGARPRRSLLFLAPSAEEPGLLGSAYFTEHPTVPLDSIVADINMDLIGRNWTDSVIAVGIEQSDLGTILRQVVSEHRDLRMIPIPDRWPEERIFYRSDHYNFAIRGVPILFFTSGTHPDYHRPSDTADRIDGEKASRLVRLLFHLGTEVANQPRRPQWTAESYRQIVERK
jgi:hypothetical protein